MPKFGVLQIDHSPFNLLVKYQGGTILIAQRFVASVTEALSEDFPEARIHAVPATQEERQPYLSAQALISDTGKQLLATLRATK